MAAHRIFTCSVGCIMINISPKKFASLLPVFCAMAALLLLSGCGEDSPPNEVFTNEDVQGRVIGALYGSPSVRMADELGKSVALYTGDELMSSLNAGAVDCVIIESTAADALISRTAGARALPEPLAEYDLRFAIAKENAELLQAVNTALAALNENGTLSGLRDKYFARGSYEYVTPEDIVTRPGILTLALPPDSPPYSVLGQDGVFSGMDVDVANAVCDFLGVELEIIEYDARELVTAVWFGRADLALGWIPGEGDDLVNISDPYAHAIHVVVVRK